MLEARGGALLPGLHDHHLHLLSLGGGARLRAVRPARGARASAALAAALAARPPARAGWLRGVGYHESVAGPLDRERLDALLAEPPLRIQHRSGALWILNSAAATLGLDAGVDAPGVERDARGRASGRLFRLDAWLRERLGAERRCPISRPSARCSRASA